MGIGYRIKEAREKLGLTQTELGKLVGVTGSAITNYEKETSSPKEPIIFRLIETLNVDANYLFQDCVKLPKEVNDVTLAEYDHIKKYRFISEYSPDGASVVDTVLDREYSIAEKIKTQKDTKDDTKSPSTTAETIPMRFLSYYQRMASAGRGEYLFSDIPTDVIAVPDTPLSRKADFVIGVNGRSMEDTYFDGDKVLVEKTHDVPLGEIGIFIRGEECFIKEVGVDRLISRNEDKERYPDIIPDERRIDTIGIVLGKVGE
ncbi:MAG: XRE family transcriptional regulator [Lachnospiraceae bacterium]|nr:XRE family transcriptional regulator [Lachnospiraceae bacterium]